MGGAVLRAKEPKKTGTLSARERTSGHNPVPLVYKYTCLNLTDEIQ